MGVRTLAWQLDVWTGTTRLSAPRSWHFLGSKNVYNTEPFIWWSPSTASWHFSFFFSSTPHSFPSMTGCFQTDDKAASPLTAATITFVHMRNLKWRRGYNKSSFPFVRLWLLYYSFFVVLNVLWSLMVVFSLRCSSVYNCDGRSFVLLVFSLWLQFACNAAKISFVLLFSYSVRSESSPMDDSLFGFYTCHRCVLRTETKKKKKEQRKGETKGKVEKRSEEFNVQVASLLKQHTR